MRRRNLGRNVNGILLLDKPAGITSNAALQIVKRLFKARKGGHTGSLDPLATGLLPICLGAATKISPFLLEADKRYFVTVKLGVRTTTGDAEGRILETRDVAPFATAEIAAVLSRYTGRIEQVPPMHSAIKQNGRPLYELAHRGIEVERAPRTVVIHQLHLLKNKGDALDIDVSCSKGTYIRTLAEDIGKALSVGGHVLALRRVGAGPFNAEQMVELSALESQAEQGCESLDRWLLPMESALAQWPDVYLTPDMAFYVRQGHPVFVPRAPASGWVRLRAPDRVFMGVGRILEDGRVAPKRLLGG